MNTWRCMLTLSTRGRTGHCPYQRQILTPCGMKVLCRIRYSLPGGRYAHSLKGASWVRGAHGIRNEIRASEQRRREGPFDPCQDEGKEGKRETKIDHPGKKCPLSGKEE